MTTAEERTRATQQEPLSEGHALLEVEGLSVRFHGRSDFCLEEADLCVNRHEPVALVGPSGSGKSVFLSAIAGLLEGADVTFRRIRLHLDLEGEAREWSSSVPYETYRREAGVLWAHHAAFLFQDAINHLHPFRSVLDQLLEAVDGGDSLEEVRRICGETDGVGLLPLVDSDERIALDHLARRNAGSLSGGMCQRVFIARALLKQPVLLIADEPFTDIDRTSQRGIQDLIAHHFISGAEGGTVLLATHDREFLKRHQVERRGVIYAVDPEARTLRRIDHLDETPPPPSWQRSASVSPKLFARVTAPAVFTYEGERRPAVYSTLDLEVHCGEILGVVGESGSGKSTLAKLLARLEGERFSVAFPDIRYRGRNGLYRSLQVAFQDSAGTFNRRESVGKILESVLKTRGLATKGIDLKAVLETVHLTEQGNGAQQDNGADIFAKTPQQLSMGMQRRFSLLKALLSICESQPNGAKLVILDEVTRGLDHDNRQAVLKLLFQRRLGELTLPEDLGLIVISHDLDFVGDVADRILVMFRGWVIELAQRHDGKWRFFHPYSQRLFDEEPSELKPRNHVQQPGADLCPFYAYCPLVHEGAASTSVESCTTPPWRTNKHSTNRYLCAVEDSGDK